jgi:translation initiation factor IF-2
VTGPGTILKPTATKLPVATIKNANPVVDKGWKGVDTKTESELRSKFVRENPTPSNLPKPTVTPGVKLLRGGASPAASPKPGATVFGASTPPGGIKPSGTGSPKGTATPFRGNKGGFNPANPGAGAGTKAPSATPKLTGTPRLPGSGVTPGTQLQGSPAPKPTGRGESATPTPHVTAPVSTPKPVEHLATPPPTLHHSATPAPTPHPTVHLATPPPHQATPAPHPHTTSAPKVIHKQESGTGAGHATQHNQPVYHPGGGGNKPSGGGGGNKPAGGGGKPKPNPTAKK